MSRLASFAARSLSPAGIGLVWVSWIYFLLSFVLIPSSLIWRGLMPDTDDYLYMTQALDLLHGHDWFDPMQYRMNPDAGTFIHFSHLLAGFYALCVTALQGLLGTAGAATVTVGILPPLFFLAYMFAIRWAAIPLVGLSWASITAPLALFGVYTDFHFSPGHVDHHGLEVMWSIIATGAALRMVSDPSRLRWPLVAGVFNAIGLVVALEYLPFLAVFGVVIGLWSVVQGGRATRAASLYALAATAMSFCFLALTKSPAHIFDADVLAYSFVYVLLIAGMGVCYGGVALIGAQKLGVRLLVGGGLALGLAIGFLWRFPALKAGPYGGMDPELAKLMFDSISEALPVVRSDDPALNIILTLSWPLLATVTAIWAFYRAPQQQQNPQAARWHWLIVGSAVGSAFLLAAFYQNRILSYAQSFSALPLAFLLRQGWQAASLRYTGAALYTARVGLLLLTGPLLTILLPALDDGRSFNKGVLLFPNQTIVDMTCDQRALDDMLSLPAYYGNRPRVIMNTLNEGAELLFRTPHKVLAAPYHTNVSGNLDSAAFFRTEDPNEAEHIARRRGVELVVLCKTVSSMYVPTDDDNKVDLDEKGDVMPFADESFAQQLTTGKIPNWLKPVIFPLLGQMLLFEVVPVGATGASN